MIENSGKKKGEEVLNFFALSLRIECSRVCGGVTLLRRAKAIKKTKAQPVPDSQRARKPVASKLFKRL